LIQQNCVLGKLNLFSLWLLLVKTKTSLIIAQLAYSHNGRYRCVQVMTIFICWRPTVVNDCALPWRTLKETRHLLSMTTSQWDLGQRNTDLFHLGHIVEPQVSMTWERWQNCSWQRAIKWYSLSLKIFARRNYPPLSLRKLLPAYTGTRATNIYLRHRLCFTYAGCQQDNYKKFWNFD